MNPAARSQDVTNGAGAARLPHLFAPTALAGLAGVLIAIGLPPIGWWPTIVLGAACYLVAAERTESRPRSQFVVATVFAWSWLAPAMGWMWQLVPGGFVVAPLLFATWHGVAGVVASRVTHSPVTATNGPSLGMTARIFVRVALHALVECVRVVTPFGGVPLAGLALGVADTRLANLVRLIGPIGLSFWLLAAAGVAAETWLRRGESGWGARRGAVAVAAVLVLAQLAAQAAPHGDDTGDSLRIAVVQGGGPQGVLAINTNPRDVTQRHLAATASLTPEDRIDLVLWPENTVDVRDFSTSNAKDEIAAEARRLGALFAVGVTEDSGTNFTNAQIVVDAAGNELGRYDKVRRVPYGEYIPLRSVLGALGAPVDRIPRDAVAGTSRATLTLPQSELSSRPDGRKRAADVSLAVAISWEVFFSRRVDDGVAAGGQIVLNPTNGSSYTGEILQQQQVATSQLRAIESGRYVVQAATTGFSLVADPDGKVRKKIPIGERAAFVQEVPLRSGRTPYSYLGDMPVAVALAAGVALTAALARRRRPS